MDNAQLLILKNEFTNDPRGYGYAQFWSVTPFDGGLPPIINAARTGADIGPAIKLNNPSVDTGKIRASVTFAGFDGLVVAAQAWFEWLTANGFITVNDHLLQQLAGIPTASGSIWASADRVAMNAAMEALMRKFGSRAEELLGYGVVVTANDVSACRNVS